MSGTYELRSLTNLPTEGLFEGKLVVDKTYGYAAHGCMQCCGYDLPYMGLDPFNLLLNGSGDQSVWGENGCNGWDYDISGYFYNGWATGNPQIATANHSLITGVGVGSTTNSAAAYVPYTTEVSLHRSCPNSWRAPSGPVNVSCAVPTNYRQVDGYDAGNGILHFDYAWSSSTGNLADLAACSVREFVSYPGGDPFNWPSPPFVAVSTPNPTILPDPYIPGAAGESHDDHFHPNFLQPYQTASVTATQYYQYICPCANGEQPVNMMGPLSLDRSVYFVSPNGTWQCKLTKSGIFATVTLP
jgi:hypothetical protein